MRRPLALLPILSVLGACYRYVPLTTTPSVGTDVRSFLTPDGVSSMGPTLGRNVSIFDGRVMSENNNVWRFAVTATRTADSRVATWTGEPVEVPRSAIARMDLRVLDRPRTIRAAVLYTVGGVAVGLAIKSIAGGAKGSEGGGGSIPP